MRLVLQRARYGRVRVDEQIVGEIGPGLVLLVAIGHHDDEKELRFWANKTVNLRIFPDDDGKMNLSLLDVGGEILVVSQFTLYGNCRKGRRPSFTDSAPPDRAHFLYGRFVEMLKESGLKVETGVFQAMMDVELANDGPVTLILGND